MHLMVSGFTILGQLAMPLQQGICALTGLNWVINSPINLFGHAKAHLFPSIIQQHIYHFLDIENQFREQITDFFANKGTKIETEEEM